MTEPPTFSLDTLARGREGEVKEVRKGREVEVKEVRKVREGEAKEAERSSGHRVTFNDQNEVASQDMDGTFKVGWW